jgi:hypothetical protein
MKIEALVPVRADYNQARAQVKQAVEATQERALDLTQVANVDNAVRSPCKSISTDSRNESWLFPA